MKPRPGKALEAAMLLACRRYKDSGRADIIQHVERKVLTPKGWRTIREQPVDFGGTVEGMHASIDAKESMKEAWPIDNLTEDQRDQLAANARGISGIALRFCGVSSAEWECYWIAWAELGPFLAAPWRKSLSRDFCRAHGEVIDVGTNESGKPVVYFLDHHPHADRANAKTRVEAERAATEVLHPFEEPARKPSKYLTGKPYDPFGPEAYKSAKRQAAKEAARVKKW